MTDEEKYAYTARAQAIVEATEDYEQSHPEGSPCFSEALACMRAVMQP